MKYPDATKHDFMASIGEFCDECGHPCADHRLPECEVINQYAAWTTPRSLGRIVKRKRDGKYFFESRQWMNEEWHPLTVGEQSGLFADARDRFDSWKRITQRWEYATEAEKKRL